MDNTWCFKSINSKSKNIEVGSVVISLQASKSKFTCLYYMENMLLSTTDAQDGRSRHIFLNNDGI